MGLKRIHVYDTRYHSKGVIIVLPYGNAHELYGLSLCGIVVKNLFGEQLYSEHRYVPGNEAMVCGAGKDNYLIFNVEASYIRRRVRLGISEPLGLLKGRVEFGALCEHLIYDEIGSTVKYAVNG